MAIRSTNTRARAGTRPIFRGEVWRANLAPSIGAEQNKTRPVIIVSADAIGALPLRIVVPLTSMQAKFQNKPWFVFIPKDPHNGLSNDSAADAFQVRSLSVDRLSVRLGVVRADQMEAITAAVAICIDHP